MSPLLLALMVPLAVAEAPAAAEGTVSKVQVVGLRRVEEAVILDAVLLRSGEPIAEWKLQRDIRAIWATGFVQDVVVRADPDPSGSGTVVTFAVKEKPAVRGVHITGNKKIKEDDLKEAIDIEEFTVPSESRIAANVRAIKDKYLEKGYYLVQVEPAIKPVGDDLEEITFKITEGRKVLVRHVEITGNDNVADRKIRKYMQTKPAGILPWLTSSGTFREEYLTEDAYRVRQVLLEEGYVDANVDSPKVYLTPDKRFIEISIHVTEGPRYRLGDITVGGEFVAEEGLTRGAAQALLEGKSIKDVEEAYKRDKAAGRPINEDWSPSIRRRPFDFGSGNTPLRRGDWFRLQTMLDASQRVQDLYADQGYAFVSVQPQPIPHPDTQVADLHFVIDRGDKMRVGRINITGNNPTYDKVVRREIPVNEGDWYSGVGLKEARGRLERLGFFEKVDISTPRGDAPGTLDMNVDVSERPTGSFSVGAGYGSADSFLFTANIQKSNFLGLGYLMSVNGNISARTKQGSVSFMDPHFLDTQWTLSLSGYYNQRSYIEDEYQRGGSVQIGRYLDKRDDWKLMADYTLEDVGLISIDAYKERLFGGELYRNGLTSSVGMSLDVDKRNNRITPTRGFRASLKGDLAGGFRTNEEQVLSLFGGDFNYWEANGNFRFYQPLIKKKSDILILRYNLTLGHMQSTDGTIIPYIHRYRAGGITSVRGYTPYSLGPDIRATGYDSHGEPREVFSGSDDPTAPDDRLVVGGTETWINNLELESPIIKSAGISLVAFLDAGNTFGDPWGYGSFDPLGLRWGYGAGVRWFSPIGPLRFEYGFPINRQADERAAVFDFTIGSAF